MNKYIKPRTEMVDTALIHDVEVQDFTTNQQVIDPGTAITKDAGSWEGDWASDW